MGKKRLGKSKQCPAINEANTQQNLCALAK